MPNTPSELESSIARLSTQYILNEATGSFLLLLLSCVEGLKQRNENLYETPQQVQNIKDAVNQYICNLEESLNAKKEEKSRLLEECISLKKQLLEVYEHLYQYLSSWNVSATLVNDAVAIGKYKQEHASEKKVEFDLFYQDCAEFLNSACDVSTLKRYIGQILKGIPFKMAREKYYSFLKKCMNNAFSQETENNIISSLELFEKICAPEKFPDYGKYLPDVAEFLSEKKSSKPSTYSPEKLEEEYTDFNSVFEILTNLEDSIHTIYSDINSLIILFYLNHTFEDLTRDNFAYRDIYYSVCEILNHEINDLERETILDTLYHTIEDAVEPVIDKANELNKKEIKLLEKVLDFQSFSEDTLIILTTENFVRSCYYGDISEELFQLQSDSQAPAASKEFREKQIEKFIAFMQEYFSALSIPMRKMAMQMLLCSLPVEYSAKEVLDIIIDSIESAPSYEHKLLIVDKIGMVFADNGFHYEQVTQKHHTHHEHSCSCEQEHHHHSDCHCHHHHE